MIALSRYGFSLYLNDLARQKTAIRDLAFHDLPGVIEIIKEFLPEFQTQTLYYPEEGSFSTLLQVRKIEG